MNLELIKDIIDIATSVVGTAAVIASVTPNKTDDTIIGTVKKVVDFIGFNFGHARNDK